jgi:GT2 family glycosyltransferase
MADNKGGDLPDAEKRDRLIALGAASREPRALGQIALSAEAVFATRGGGVLMSGWLDDTVRGLDNISVVGPGWRVTFDAAGLARRTRADVDEALGRSQPYPYGYMGFVFGDREIQCAGPCEMEFRFRDGGAVSAPQELKPVEDLELRLILLAHLSSAPHLGGVTTNAVASLARSMGDHVIRFNRSLTTPITRNPYVERFGEPQSPVRGSIVVCLYGRPEYQFVQSALFSVNEGIADYEFIYVSNSPELADTLLANARNAHRTYGINQTLVLLPGNAGFGAANNVAVRSARSDRILIVNPDVLPRDNAWARKHTELVDARPTVETDLFGVPLYYDDGSLMHGGMYFEMDTQVSFDRNRTAVSRLLRVEHYGKGAPAETPRLTRPRPVPAVTGAFMSLARSWFEQLGGFTEDYVFGHYEDADLCLKSLTAGVAPWLHDLRLWHLEGKGSTRLPVHEGGSLVNRWLFSSRWGETVSDGLLGPDPAHPLIAGTTQ